MAPLTRSRGGTAASPATTRVSTGTTSRGRQTTSTLRRSARLSGAAIHFADTSQRGRRTTAKEMTEEGNEQAKLVQPSPASGPPLRTSDGLHRDDDNANASKEDSAHDSNEPLFFFDDGNIGYEVEMRDGQCESGADCASQPEQLFFLDDEDIGNEVEMGEELEGQDDIELGPMEEFRRSSREDALTASSRQSPGSQQRRSPSREYERDETQLVQLQMQMAYYQWYAQFLNNPFFWIDEGLVVDPRGRATERVGPTDEQTRAPSLDVTTPRTLPPARRRRRAQEADASGSMSEYEPVSQSDDEDEEEKRKRLNEVAIRKKEDKEESKNKRLPRTTEHGPCTICARDEVVVPVGCLHCRNFIGCRKCCTQWHRTARLNSEAEPPTASCPLCRAAWTMPFPEVTANFRKKEGQTFNKYPPNA